eukprot:gene14000-16549_t
MGRAGIKSAYYVARMSTHISATVTGLRILQVCLQLVAGSARQVEREGTSDELADFVPRRILLNEKMGDVMSGDFVTLLIALASFLYGAYNDRSQRVEKRRNEEREAKLKLDFQKELSNFNRLQEDKQRQNKQEYYQNNKHGHLGKREYGILKHLPAVKELYTSHATETKKLSSKLYHDWLAWKTECIPTDRRIYQGEEKKILYTIWELPEKQSEGYSLKNYPRQPLTLTEAVTLLKFAREKHNEHTHQEKLPDDAYDALRNLILKSEKSHICSSWYCADYDHALYSTLFMIGELFGWLEVRLFVTWGCGKPKPCTLHPCRSLERRYGPEIRKIGEVMLTRRPTDDFEDTRYSPIGYAKFREKMSSISYLKLVRSKLPLETEELDELMKQYRKPLLASAYDLQQRLVQIQKNDFLYTFMVKRYKSNTPQ